MHKISKTNLIRIMDSIHTNAAKHSNQVKFIPHPKGYLHSRNISRWRIISKENFSLIFSSMYFQTNFGADIR